MGTPDRPAGELLIVLMVAVTAYHLVRLASGRRGRRIGVDLTHAPMGVVMALMLAGGLGAGGARLLLGCFTVAAAWCAVRAVRTYVLAGAPAAAPGALQTLPVLAMVYMLAVTAAPRSATGMAMPAGATPLTWLLVAGLVFGTVPVAGPRPSVDGGCRIAMSATACFMLLT